MSFAGTVMDMIARMKANTRPRRNPFSREVLLKQQVNPELLKPMTAEVKAELSRKLTATRRASRLKDRVVLVAVVLLVLCALWFFLS